MGLAQPGTPADSFDFPSCPLMDVVSADGTIGCCFFAMCYYVLFDSEVPLKGTGILLSAWDSPRGELQMAA